MALDIQLRHQAGYFRATLKGTVRLAECREVLRQIVGVTPSSGTYPILVNVQATLCQLSDKDVVALMEESSAHRAVLPKKIAVVYREQAQGEVAKSFELSAWIYDFRVRAFTEQASAVQWLDDTTANRLD